MKNIVTILLILSNSLSYLVSEAQVELKFKITPPVPAIAANPAAVPPILFTPSVPGIIDDPEIIPLGTDLLTFNLKDLRNLQVKIEGTALAPAKFKLVMAVHGSEDIPEFTIPLSPANAITATGGIVKFNDVNLLNLFAGILAKPENFYFDLKVKYDGLEQGFKDIGKANSKIQQKVTGTLKTSVEGVEVKGSDVYVEPSATNDQLAFAAYQYARVRPQLVRSNRQGDRIILLDLRGRMLSNELKNVSQTERFTIRVIVPFGTEHNYDIRIDEGEYAPSDLSIRPFTPIATINSALPTDSEPNKAKPNLIPMTYVEFTRGPYTTSQFKFTLLRTNGSGTVDEFGPFSIKINPIYHVGVGVSVVNSWLQDPSYELRSLGNNTNTIAEVNKGQRAFLTFNVVWYWRKSVAALFNSRKNPLDSEITQGRDILKEGGFWDRLNPTLGMSLTDKLFNNYFAGLTLELARGLNVVGGLHYGRVTRFDNPSFSIGTTVFSGNADQIPLTRVWKYDWSVGIMVDTRVFNLFVQNRQ